MEAIINRIVDYLDKDKNIWSEKEHLWLLLGLQVLIHNIVMISTILFVAQITGIFLEASILLITYGMLKMSAGGIHFEKSLTCVIGTGIFVELGVLIAKHLELELKYIVLVYIVCLVVLAVIGPQGTRNNPITEENYEKLRKKTILLVIAYLGVTVYMTIFFNCVPYLLFIAVVFETLSLLPLYVINRN